MAAVAASSAARRALKGQMRIDIPELEPVVEAYPAENVHVRNTFIHISSVSSPTAPRPAASCPSSSIGRLQSLFKEEAPTKGAGSPKPAKQVPCVLSLADALLETMPTTPDPHSVMPMFHQGQAMDSLEREWPAAPQAFAAGYHQGRCHLQVNENYPPELQGSGAGAQTQSFQQGVYPHEMQGMGESHLQSFQPCPFPPELQGNAGNIADGQPHYQQSAYPQADFQLQQGIAEYASAGQPRNYQLSSSAESWYPSPSFQVDPAVNAQMPAHLPMPPAHPPAQVPEVQQRIASQAPSGPAPGTSQLPSMGSKEHLAGDCKPCAFLHTKGCEMGVMCKFCHLCGSGEKKRRQKAKKAMYKLGGA